MESGSRRRADKRPVVLVQADKPEGSIPHPAFELMAPVIGIMIELPLDLR